MQETFNIKCMTLSSVYLINCYGNYVFLLFNLKMDVIMRVMKLYAFKSFLMTLNFKNLKIFKMRKQNVYRIKYKNVYCHLK